MNNTKFAGVASLMEGQFLPAVENGAVSNITSWNPQSNIINKEGQNFDPMKAWMQKGCQVDASWIIKYATLEAKVHNDTPDRWCIFWLRTNWGVI